MILGWFATTRWGRKFRTRGAIERRQKRLLRKHLAFLAQKSPYFAAVISSPDQPITSLPIMDKTAMMAHFDEMNTVGLARDQALELAIASERERDFEQNLGDVSVGLSSGTTGRRGLFIVSAREREAWAGTMLARTLPRGALLGNRVALFLRADNTLYESVGSKTLAFEYFDIYADLATNVRRLEAFDPTILVAPPSVLRAIADEFGDRPMPLRPQRIYSVAEVLEPTDEAFLIGSFDVALIHQLYQCTEGFLAHTCERGVLHLNEDNMIIEREELGGGRFVPIVTDLQRRAQPIVRYRLGDVLSVKSAPCACGSALTAIDRIEGREGDILEFRGVDKPRVRVFADQIARSMVHVEGVGEYRVTQTAQDTCEVSVLPAAKADEVASELHRLFTAMRCVAPTLTFTPYDHDSSRKLRRVARDYEWGTTA